MAYTQVRNERGITIIETTVILSVLFILAGVMSPIVGESVATARAVKAKNDASMIAMGLINLQKDLGGDALSYGGAAALTSALTTTVAPSTSPARLPDVLASDGQAPDIDETEETPVLDAALTLFARPGQRSDGNDRQVSPHVEVRRKWREGVDSLDAHLRSNKRGYRFRRPGEYGGWNGPYVSAEIKGDPWGNQYVINSRWFDGGITAADRQGRTRRAVFVVSAGGNGVIETPFEQPINDAVALGDDIVIRIQ